MIYIIDNNIFSKNQPTEGLLNIETLNKLLSFSYLIEEEIVNTNIPYINLMKNFLISCINYLDSKSLEKIVNKISFFVFDNKKIYIIYYLMNLIFELNLSKKINEDENILNILSHIKKYENVKIEFNKKTTILLLQIFFELYIIDKGEIDINQFYDNSNKNLIFDALISYGKRNLEKKKNQSQNEDLKNEEESIDKILFLNSELHLDLFNNSFKILETEKEYNKINEFLLSLSEYFDTILFNKIFDEKYNACSSFYSSFLLYELNKNENTALNSIYELSETLLFCHSTPFIFKFLKNIQTKNITQTTIILNEIVNKLKNYNKENKKNDNEKKNKKINISFNRNCNIIHSLIFTEYLIKGYGENLGKDEEMIKLIKSILFNLTDLLINRGLIYSPWLFTTYSLNNNVIKKPICEIIIDILLSLYLISLSNKMEKNEDIVKEIEKICFPLSKEFSLFYIIDCIKNINQIKNNTPIQDNDLFKKIKLFNKYLGKYFPNKYFEPGDENSFEHFNYSQYFLGKFIIQDRANSIKLLSQENDFLYKICVTILENLKKLMTEQTVYIANDNEFELYNMIKKITGEERRIGLNFGDLKTKIEEYLKLYGNYNNLTKKEIYAYRCMENESNNNNEGDYSSKNIISVDNNTSLKNSSISLINIQIKTSSSSLSNIQIKEKNSNILINDNNHINNISDNNNQIKYDNCNKQYIVFYPKRDLLCNCFGIEFKDIFFYNEKFVKMKMYYISHFNVEKESKVFNYPSKIKNFSYKGIPPLFLTQDLEFFDDDIFFRISNLYFEYSKNKIQDKKINLVKKDLIFNKNNYFICELISRERCYIGNLYICDSFFIFKLVEMKDITNGNEDLILFSQFNYLNEKVKKEKTVLMFYDEIKEIIIKRKMLLKTALEIYLKNGKTYLFNFFIETQFEKFLKKIPKDKIKISKKDIKKYQEKWKKGEITTYYYIIKLNQLSSRSYNDPTQYPVFPWLLNDYKELNLFFEKSNEKHEENFRIFKYPISLQNENLRIKAIHKFEDKDNIDNSIHNGTHYSTSSYIFYYLMRQNPFMKDLIKLQGNHQENPNRMFYSIDNTINTVVEGNDSREIIPEFFSKIEFLINLNCFNFGIQYNKNQVDDIQMNNMYCYEKFNLSIYVKFIIQHFLLINGNKILNSKNSICNWIDNVFGVNQYPEKAKESYNIFNKFSYEKYSFEITNLEKQIFDNVDNKKKNIAKNELKNNLEYIVNFGICPTQILFEISSNRIEKKYDENIIFDQEKKSDELINIAIHNKQLCYIIKNGERIILNDIILKNTFQLFSNTNEKSTIYLKNPFYSYLYIYLNNKKLLITCRHIDNSLKIYDENKNETILFFNEFISSIKKIPKSKSILLGMKSGKLIKYNIEKNKIENKIQAHENMINVIEINYILKIIITSGDDNYIYIRKLYDFELLTFIKIHNNYSIKTIKMNRMNLIYCLCSYENLLNKDDEDYGIQSKIFGYTVTGIQFANYSSKDLLGNDFYFTNNLNILVNKYGTNELLILNSFDLSLKKIEKIKEFKSNSFIYDCKFLYYKDIQNKINKEELLIPY